MPKQQQWWPCLSHANSSLDHLAATYISIQMKPLQATSLRATRKDLATPKNNPLVHVANALSRHSKYSPLVKGVPVMTFPMVFCYKAHNEAKIRASRPSSTTRSGDYVFIPTPETADLLDV